MKITSILFLVAFLAGCANKESSTTASEDKADSVSNQTDPRDRYAELRHLDERVKIEDIPATNVVTLHFTGNYQNHPEAYGKLASYVASRYRTGGGVIGMYPQDPDLVEESKLTWEISLRVLPGKAGSTATPNVDSPFTIEATPEELGTSLLSLPKASPPFELRQLPSIYAATLISDVAHIGADGLLINAWITMNNYVQNGTTRTEFGSPSQKSQLIPVKIIVPVKKRTVETIK